MSVIVRGMEMPADCRACPFESYSSNSGQTVCVACMKVMATAYRTIEHYGRPKWCPLFEVKDWREI